MKLLEQLELFPVAGQKDIDSVFELLGNYKQMKNYVKDFESNPKTSGDYEKYKVQAEAIHYIDRAFNLITDDEVKRVIEQRFFKTNKRKITLAIFYDLMSESTVDRRIDEGVESIANTLKMWGVI